MSLTSRQTCYQGTGAGGFTLLEVLLTLVVLSVGLLGLAAMQVVGLKSNNTASYRSQATLIAADMVERIRLNPRAISDPDNPGFPNRYLNLLPGSDPYTDCSTLPKKFCSNYLDKNAVIAGQSCTPQEMADFDINMVYCGQIKDSDKPTVRVPTGVNALPKGQMTVICLTAPNCSLDSPDYTPEYVVSVSWTEQTRAANGTSVDKTQSIAVPFVPWSQP